MKRRKKTKIRRLNANEVELVASMQRDIDFMKNFIVNITAVAMDTVKSPAILSTSMCSDDVDMITSKCWQEVVENVLNKR